MKTIDTKDAREIFNNLKKSPILKIVAIGAAILFLIFLVGKVMNVVAGAITEFKGLKTAILS